MKIKLEKKFISIKGFSFFGKNIGIKDNTLDFGGIYSDTVCEVGAVFTKNTMPGAPIIIGKEHIIDGKLQAIIVNSKNANVATEQKGIDDARYICQLVAQSCEIEDKMVLPSSTGVIGQRLPMDIIIKGCQTLKDDFGSNTSDIKNFAYSIMTTDTRAKYISVKIGNSTILGIAKGSGMIEPNMATMLCYFVTDAKISTENLQPILKRCVDKSFNRISVDSDTSTSDTVVILANGESGIVDIALFEQALLEMSIYLAKEIARDGEGATKLIELKVSGASTQEQALLTAKAVLNSPLVKTAIYGADPNWGRFVMAIGKVFQYQVDIQKLTIYFGTGDNRFKINAKMIDNDSVPLKKISNILEDSEIYIEIVLGNGEYSEIVWGCDLTEEYIKINAEYTT